MSAEYNEGALPFPDKNTGDEGPVSIELRRRQEPGSPLKALKVIEEDLLYLQEYGYSVRKLFRAYRPNFTVDPYEGNIGMAVFVRINNDELYLPDFVSKTNEHKSRGISISFRDEAEPYAEELVITLTYPDKHNLMSKIASRVSFRYSSETGRIERIHSLEYDRAGNQINTDINIVNFTTVSSRTGNFSAKYDPTHEIMQVHAGTMWMGQRLIPILALQVPVQINKDKIIEGLFPDKEFLRDPFDAPAYMDHSWLHADLKRVFGIRDDIDDNFASTFQGR